MKRAFHFATIPGILKIVVVFDLFASARKAVFPAPAATRIHRWRNTWSSLLSQLVDNYGDNSADNVQPEVVGRDVGDVPQKSSTVLSEQSLDPQSKIPGSVPDVGLLYRTYLCTSLNECLLPQRTYLTEHYHLFFVFRLRVQLYPHLSHHL